MNILTDIEALVQLIEAVLPLFKKGAATQDQVTRVVTAVAQALPTVETVVKTTEGK